MSIKGSPFAIVSFVKPYCFAKNLQFNKSDQGKERKYAKLRNKGAEKTEKD